MDEDLKRKLDYITIKTSKKTGFFTFNNYFDIVEKDIIHKTSFKIPKNYFLTIEDKILSKTIAKEKRNQQKEIKIISLLKTVSFSAIASILLFTAFYFLNKKDTNSFDNITIAEIESWYDNNYEISNNDEFANILEESDFINAEIPSINIDEKILEDYLNSIDNSNLIQQNQ